MKIRSDNIVTVVGAGTMGAGIAQVAALAGHPVVIVDAQQAALDRGRASLSKALDGLVARGKLTGDTARAALDRIRWSTDLAAAAGSALAIEAIVEKLEAKTALFAALDALLPADAILASNTSSLSIEAMAAASSRPDRLVGLHFFNPVPAMKLVEIIGADATAPALLDALVELMRAWGKSPIVARDVPGFIVNRVARPYYAEAFTALGEGLDPSSIDHAMTGAGGFRMGPLTLADLIGHDINYAASVSVFDGYAGKTRFRPQPIQQKLVADGTLGRKSGSGVYDYSAPIPDPALAASAHRPAGISVAADTGPLAPLVDAARDAGIGIEVDPVLADGTIDIGGVILAQGDGRRLADRPGIDALVDHARDLATAGTILLTAREPAAAVAVGFVEALGRKALIVADRPGQIVLRTLAQLANSAADAVRDAVSSADGIDQAMMLGANHPEGPLAWAGRIGHARLAAILDNIAAATGDAIYQPSAGLRA